MLYNGVCTHSCLLRRSLQFNLKSSSINFAFGFSSEIIQI